MGGCQSSKRRPGSYENSAIPSAGELVESISCDLPLHDGSVLGIASQNGLIVSGGEDKSVALVARSSLVPSFHESMLRRLEGHSKAVNRVCFARHTSEHFVWSASRDLSLRFWRVHTGDCALAISDAHSLNISAIATPPSSEHRVYSGSRDYSVKVWDVGQNGAPHLLREFKSPRNIVTCMTTSSDAPDLLYQGSEDLCVRVWDVRSGQATIPAQHLTGYVYFPLCMSAQSESNILATGCKGFNRVGCTITLWDRRQTSTPLGELVGHEQDVTGVEFSGQTPWLYSVSKDSTVRVWDVRSLSLRGQYRFPAPPTKLLSCLTVLAQESDSSMSSRFEEEVVVGSMDGSVTVLRCSATGEEVHVTPVVATTPTVDAEEITV